MLRIRNVEESKLAESNRNCWVEKAMVLQVLFDWAERGRKKKEERRRRKSVFLWLDFAFGGWLEERGKRKEERELRMKNEEWKTENAGSFSLVFKHESLKLLALFFLSRTSKHSQSAYLFIVFCSKRQKILSR